LRRAIAGRLGGTATLDARLLVAAALGADGGQLALLDERPVTPAEAAAAWRLTERRLAGEPVSRILGRRAFWSFDLLLGPDTLDPRPDTETVVEAALEPIRSVAAPAILDLGTGSGAILLALLGELPEATGIGVDLSAVAVARENARRLGLAARARFVVGNWGESIAGRFDAIVANPPYIRSADIPGLAPEVRSHDPLLALDGGADGLAAYRSIVADLGRLLKPGGFAVFEVGQGQAAEVAALAALAGFIAETRDDLAGLGRAVTLTAIG
jgi:release factor glutamine methyltransferase